VSSTSLTSAGQIVGTPAYLSPEQARGPDVDAHTDQFALAVTAFLTSLVAGPAMSRLLEPVRQSDL